MNVPAPILLPVAHVPQRQDADCLAACAAMVLGYLGREIPYHRLMRTLGIQSGVGAPFSNLRALTRLKANVIYVQGTVAQLYRFLTNGWPIIIPVKTRELPYWEGVDTDHALVVVGMGTATVYLNDPAFANVPLQVALGDFELAWIERGEVYAVLG